MSPRKIFDDDFKFITNSMNMKKIKFEIVKVMKFTSKARSCHMILNITFNDKF